jgi:hypothetical protein
LTNDDIDYIKGELKQTTVGYINTKWTSPPQGTHWANAMARLDAIKLQVELKGEPKVGGTLKGGIV